MFGIGGRVVFCCFFGVLGFVFFVGFGAGAQGVGLEIGEGDSVVLIGNTLAERQALFGYFETALHCKYPAHRLRVRNMGWSADEVGMRPRPVGFGDIHRWLGAQEADVILAFYGFNESFQGAERGQGIALKAML